VLELTNDALRDALDRFTSVADQPGEYSFPFLDLLPASGAAVSTLGDFLGNETVSATDRIAARLDELQFDLGEGPCWDALRTVRPVYRPDVAAVGSGAPWPAFTRAMVAENVRSIFAFPLVVGTLRIGAVDIYSIRPLELTRSQAQDIGTLAALTGRHVLRSALAGLELEPDDPGSREFPRRVVHQATGMVMAQLQLSADDATLVIQGHAFAASRSVMEVADDIVKRRLDISDPEVGG
jgi:hypothetical protein